MLPANAGREEDKKRPFKRLHYWDRPEYGEKYRDLKRFAVTQTPANAYVKTQGVNNNNDNNNNSHHLVGKVIHWELGKKLKFDRTNK